MTSAEKKPEIGQWVYAFSDEFSNEGVPIESTGKVVSHDFPPALNIGGKKAEGWAVEVEFYLPNKKTDPVFIEQEKYKRHLVLLCQFGSWTPRCCDNML